MDIQIREAVLDDARGIATAHVESWRAAYTGIVAKEWLAAQNVENRTQSWQHNLKETHHPDKKVYVACNDAIIAGFATVGQPRIDGYSDYAELWAIYTHPDYFGRGVGTLLFNASVEHTRALKCANIFVNVLRDNALGRKFYERMGGVLIPSSEGMVELGDKEYADIKYEWKGI